MSAKDNGKVWWQSKTLWVNAAIGLLAVADTLTDVLKPVVPPEAMGVILTGLAAANIILRAATGQPIVAKKPSPKSPS